MGFTNRIQASSKADVRYTEWGTLMRFGLLQSLNLCTDGVPERKTMHSTVGVLEGARGAFLACPNTKRTSFLPFLGLCDASIHFFSPKYLFGFTCSCSSPSQPAQALAVSSLTLS